jgi:hypothetical protein
MGMLRTRRSLSTAMTGWRKKGKGAVRSQTVRRDVFALVDARTGGEHLVTNDAMDSGRDAGRYVAVCGTVLLASSVTAPSDRYCRACAEWVQR